MLGDPGLPTELLRDDFRLPMIIVTRKIRKDNVEEFWTELKSLLGDSAKKDQGQPASETTKSAKKTDPGATPNPRYPQQQKEPQKDE